MLVLVLNALMPLASRSMTAMTDRGDFIEVCTSTGMVRVALEGSADTDPSETMALEGCPFCLLHNGQIGLPPLSVTVPVVQPYEAMPLAFYKAAVNSWVWLTALSRGPPVLMA